MQKSTYRYSLTLTYIYIAKNSSVHIVLIFIWYLVRVYIFLKLVNRQLDSLSRDLYGSHLVRGPFESSPSGLFEPVRHRALMSVPKRLYSNVKTYMFNWILSVDVKGVPLTTSLVLLIHPHEHTLFMYHHLVIFPVVLTSAKVVKDLPCHFELISL